MFKLLILLLVFSASGFTQELVWKNSDHIIIAKKLEQNPIYKKRRLRRDHRLELNQLGTAVSPYFKKDNEYYRYFQTISNCYKLTLKESVNLYSKSQCKTNFNTVYIKVAGKEAKSFKPTKDKPSSIIIKNTVQSFNYIAHRNSFGEIEDINDLGKYPTQPIDVLINKELRLERLRGKIQIINLLKISRSKLGYLPLKNVQKKQTLKFDLQSKRDFVFKDDQNNYYFFKRYQPSPFTFKYLNVSPKFINHLENIESLFFSFNNVRRCFRNDWLSESDYDCDTLIYQKTNLESYYHMSLLKIDYKNASYQVLN